MLAQGSTALAAPPPNDDFPGATVSGLPTSTTGSSVEATKEPGEPDHGGVTGGASVWWSWTAPSSGMVTIDTCGSDFDTVVGVYTGDAVDSLAPVASNDDSCGSQSAASFAATAGTTYRIAVDDFFAVGGNIALGIAPTPVNDDFPGTTLSGPAASATGTNVGATREDGEPMHHGNVGGRSVWWSWTAPSSGTVTVDTCGSDFDTVLSVYTGSSFITFTTWDSNDDSCGTQSSVTFGTSAGLTFRIAVDGKAGATGNIALHITPPPPANDNFPGTTLSGLPTSTTGTNAGAGKQAGEPDHAGDSGGASVWWSWTAPSTGPVTVDTCGSDFDTLLGVYVGGSVGSLSETASNNDSCGSQSEVSFTANAGTTYRIAVDGAGGALGNIALAIAPVDTTPPETTIDSGPSGPTNDSTPTFTFSSNEPGSTFECRFDSDPFAACSGPGDSHTPSAPLAEGDHTFEVRATDLADNTDPTPASRSFTVDTTLPDTTPPETTILSGPSGVTNDSTPTFTFSSDEAGSTFECRFDSDPFAACSGPGDSHTPSAPLPDAGHTFEVRATDAAGNTDPTPASRSFTVNTQAPDPPTIGGTAPASPANDNNPEVYGLAEAGSTVTLYQSDSCLGPIEAEGDAATFSSPGLTASVADNGTTQFTATATDGAGNVSGCSAPFSYSEDSTAPQTTIESGPSGVTSDPTPTFTFSSSEPNSTFECRIDTDPFAACIGRGDSHTPSAPLPDGAHTFEVRAIDPAGNADPTPASRSFTVQSGTPDTTPPETTIDSGPSGPTTDSTPTFTFSSDEPGSTFECRFDSDPFASCSGFGDSHTPSAPLPEGDHTFEVRATDLALNTDPTPASRSFTVVAPTPDTTPPDTTIISGPGGLTRDTTPTFAFSTNESGSTLQCRFDAAGFGPCSGPGYLHTPSTPLPDGSHTIWVRAVDAAGNADPTPASRSFTVDTRPPNAGIRRLRRKTTKRRVRIRFVSSEAGSRFRCKLDRGRWRSCRPRFRSRRLSLGRHRIVVVAIDRVGNVDRTPARRKFRVVRRRR